MFIVEGNIGVGKSTFVSLIPEHLPQAEAVLEPVESWNSAAPGQSLLSNFYTNPKRWAYTLENLTLLYRSRNHRKEQLNPSKNRFFERSIYSGHFCFAKNSYDAGFMTPIEWEVYNRWATFLLAGQCNEPTGFIYLKAQPQTCLERVKKRQRSAETSLSLEYLEQIHEKHDAFLIHKKGLPSALTDVPVLVIDVEDDFVASAQERKRVFDLVREFVANKI